MTSLPPPFGTLPKIHLIWRSHPSLNPKPSLVAPAPMKVINGWGGKGIQRFVPGNSLVTFFWNWYVKTPRRLFILTLGFYYVECKYRSNSTSEFIAWLNRAPRLWNVNWPKHDKSIEAENVKRAYDSNPIFAINESWQKLWVQVTILAAKYQVAGQW